jgi:hypothetical protein
MSGRSSETVVQQDRHVHFIRSPNSCKVIKTEY